MRSKPCAACHTRLRWGRQVYCKPCRNKRLAAARKGSAEIRRREVFRNRTSRARKNGVKVAIRFEDLHWPTYCPVLGIRLDYDVKGDGKVRPNSPSIDRVSPGKGYVKGNVIVVSQKANSIKSNATPHELERVAAFYRQFIQ